MVRRCSALCCGKGSDERHRYGCVLAGWHDHARYADDDSRTVRGCGYDWRCKLVREEHGVAQSAGISDGRAPEAGITREQLVTMLHRYADVPEAGGTLDAFADADTVSAYAVDAMRWAAANGIVNGSHGRLNPQGQCHPRTGRGDADAVL